VIREWDVLGNVLRDLAEVPASEEAGYSNLPSLWQML
jgi:hypothetical protein